MVKCDKHLSMVFSTCNVKVKAQLDRTAYRSRHGTDNLSALVKASKNKAILQGKILSTRINNTQNVSMLHTIHDLSAWNKPLIDTCQYCSTSRANQVLHFLVNLGFQNRGVCLQAFPSFPSPLFHVLALASFLARQKPKTPFLGLSLLQNQTLHSLRIRWWIQVAAVSPFNEEMRTNYLLTVELVKKISEDPSLKHVYIMSKDRLKAVMTMPSINKN